MNSTPTTPICPRCNERPRKVSKTGKLYVYCADCHAERIRQNAEKVREYGKRYRQENAEKIKQYYIKQRESEKYKYQKCDNITVMNRQRLTYEKTGDTLMIEKPRRAA